MVIRRWVILHLFTRSLLTATPSPGTIITRLAGSGSVVVTHRCSAQRDGADLSRPRLPTHASPD
ncbi:protein of unknown function (plasmid) [Agrobacterium pusense]|uniref:Uncharacterized protein n=1 Tax=Agrobacterium pusense TaxID=648995 RepID=U4QF99_9HYPH|nr:protein of unknown function [Agrobacterium pusense]